ncbi:hypothetical protein [Nocardioides antri]|uniref:Aminoglycoside phosphotransferase domain-containing protein n=1 Tax=Nocardioides antri TaxID=2607659 RepID=A0A5B1LR13_9ACTN|nr:hypothetical protein [Nocardioides antri]KAA1423182.1 hypothetical protein F0U47_20105 [Nocardioides antri]
MMQTWTSAVWRSEAFAAELRAFVTAAVGEPEVFEPLKIRPWSAVWRVEAGGSVYFAKQNCPGQAHEAGLVAVLARLAPEYVVPVVAADPGRDLLLTADLGRTLAELGGDHDVDTWCRIVRDAALLQRAVVSHVDQLGLTEMPPEATPAYVGDAIGRLGALPHDDPRRLGEDVARRLCALMPTIERWSDDVADLDLPLTLNHNDLHGANVVATNGPEVPLRFFDFGDAVATEPLGSLFIPLAVCAADLGAGPDDLRLRRIADAALEVWTDLAPARAMRAALPAALQLARVARVESWRRCVRTMTTEERAEFGSAPAERLATLVADPPVGHLPPM